MVLCHQVGWDARFAQRSPTFWPLAAAGAHFARCADWPTRAELGAMYVARAVARGGEPLAFVENVRKQDRYEGERLVLERLYDGRIAAHAEVPTRERDWHDFFNALCFATFPRAKRALHRRQFAILRRRVAPGATRLPGARSREQDALTLWDEGGAAVAVTAASAEALASSAADERDPLLLDLAERGQARFVPFGHAVFEHLVEGLRCPLTSTRILAVASVELADEALIEALDHALAQRLADPGWFLGPREPDVVLSPASRVLEERVTLGRSS